MRGKGHPRKRTWMERNSRMSLFRFSFSITVDTVMPSRPVSERSLVHHTPEARERGEVVKLQL